MGYSLSEMEVYSFHTSSRFGSRIKIQVDDNNLLFTGPRMGFHTYSVWLTIQTLLTASVILTLSLSLVRMSPLYLFVAIGLLALHIGGCLWGTAIWELMNIFGHETVSISVDEIKNAQTGRGWSRNNLWMRIPLYTLAINKFSPNEIISFEAPDEAARGAVVYALMFLDEKDAIFLKKLLRANERG